MDWKAAHVYFEENIDLCCEDGLAIILSAGQAEAVTRPICLLLFWRKPTYSK